MAERIALSCEPEAAAVVAGGDPVAIIVTVRNLSNVVDQFDLAVVGVPPEWYELEPAVVSVFPGESAQATLWLKPPRREDVTAGDYPLTLNATSRDNPAESSGLTFTLAVRPSGGFELVLTKAKAVGRSGTFRAHLTNLSDGTIDLLLRVSDPASALVIRPPEQSVTLEPYRERHVTFSVRPKKRPFTGEEESYPLTVEAIPKLPDPQEAAQLTQKAQGEFVYKPRLRRWPWAPLPGWARLALMAAVPLLAGLVLLFALQGNGSPEPVPTPTPNARTTPGAPVTPPAVGLFEIERQGEDSYLLKWDVSGDDVEVLVDGTPESAKDSKRARGGEHVLVAKNAAGEVVERRCAVPVAAPRIIEFKADSTTVAAGDEVTFRWEVEGVVDRADINGEVVICDSRQSCDNEFPEGRRTLTVDTDTNFLLTVENEAGFSVKRERVQVTP